jgi:hypothetical protein
MDLTQPRPAAELKRLASRLPRVLLSILILTLLLSTPLLPVMAQQTPSPTAPSDGGLYIDPGGRFTAPIPANWTV